MTRSHRLPKKIPPPSTTPASDPKEEALLSEILSHYVETLNANNVDSLEKEAFFSQYPALTEKLRDHLSSMFDVITVMRYSYKQKLVEEADAEPREKNDHSPA